MRRVVLNADDLGYDPAVTRGIIESMRSGIVSSTTFMVNTPYSEAAAKEAGGLAVGLHFNLARWHAISDPTHEFVESKASTLPPSFIESELRAQLKRLESLLGQEATHIDVHKHLHRLPNVLTGLIAGAGGLPIRSPDEAVRNVLRAAGVTTNDLMLGDAEGDAYWSLETLESQLRAMPTTGFIELMCHPGYAPSHLTSGYGVQREVELATFTSPKARELLETLNLQLSSWAQR